MIQLLAPRPYPRLLSQSFLPLPTTAVSCLFLFAVIVFVWHGGSPSFFFLPPPGADEIAMGHSGPPPERDGLLTRSVLVFCTVENLRDANALLRAYMSDVEERDSEMLRMSYMNKGDGYAPSHVIFCSMILRICEKSVKTGPLYSWLLRSFNTELTRMFKPDIVKAYTTKIGRVYFNIQPPPSMMNTIENMMGMMGGGGMGGGGAPGLGGGAPGGMNPAMMQAMMQGMQGGM